MLDRGQLDTIGVLKDMKQMLVTMVTLTHNTYAGSPSYNPLNSPANVGHFPDSFSALTNNDGRIDRPPRQTHLTPSSSSVQPITSHLLRGLQTSRRVYEFPLCLNSKSLHHSLVQLPTRGLHRHLHHQINMN